MRRYLQSQLKFNTFSLLQKLRFITVVVSLLLGNPIRTNAEQVQVDEFMSIPPHEPFYIEEKKQIPFSTTDKNTFSDRDALMYEFKNSKTRLNARIEDYKKDTTSVEEQVYGAFLSTSSSIPSTEKR
jgi:hypothetical protein